MSIILDENGAPAQGADANLIKDGTEATFAQDVMEASRERPVIVDFWSPGCEPCKTLMPMLEKLVKAMGGAVALVKINVQDAQNLAMQLRIQSVPTVYMFKDDRPVDAFNGAIPESQLRQFIEKHIGEGGSPIQQALAQAEDLLENGEAQASQDLFMQILQHDQGNPQAIAGVIRTHIELGSVDQAEEIITALNDELKRNEHIKSAIAAMELAGQGSVDESEIAAFQEALAADPDNHQARFDFALSLYSMGQNEAALEQLLEIVRKDRTWNEDGARLQMLKIFEALGNTDPATVKARKKLTTLLFV